MEDSIPYLDNLLLVLTSVSFVSWLSLNIDKTFKMVPAMSKFALALFSSAVEFVSFVNCSDQRFSRRGS